MGFGMRRPRPFPEVVVYGTAWCAATQMLRRYLQRRGIPYRYVDLEEDPRAEARVRWWTGGAAKHPTVSIDGGVLVEPTLDEVEWALAETS
jgi:mycoredoxin